MKGIILAGGKATRLRPATLVTSKQLLLVYDQPMIMFPLQTLLKAGIKDILIIVSPEFAGHFIRLLGNGKQFGAKFTYEVQEQPNGLAEAFVIGEQFIDGESVAMILGDNIYEDDFTEAVQSFSSGGRVFAKKVHDPERFGVVEFDGTMRAIGIEEKPKTPRSDYAVTGFYVYDHTVVEKAKSLTPSPRGELEITDINRLYLEEGCLDVRFVEGRWIDSGTFESLYEATSMVREWRTGAKQQKDAVQQLHKTLVGDPVA